MLQSTNQSSKDVNILLINNILFDIKWIINGKIFTWL